VVGALPAHVEVVFEADRETAFTREAVHIVRVHPALIAALQSPLVVGDAIVVATLQSGQRYAIDALPRRTLLARPAVAREKLPQPLVSNADVLWIVVATANPGMRPAMVDRFLVAAAAGGLEPRLCVTKTDLTSDPESLQWLELYERIGFRVVRTSVTSGTGLPEMRTALTQGFSVLVGQSGVGKSSIVRAILPEQPIAVGEISEATGKGRHTTTVTRYYRLPEGGAVVDTPGLRELGLWGADRPHLDIAFPDIARLAAGCRFANCRHETEPGCAVRTAPEIPAERLASFAKLSEEIDQRLRPGFGKPGGPTLPR
jgi:ribosome biogenesis GTPase